MKMMKYEVTIHLLKTHLLSPPQKDQIGLHDESKLAGE